MQVSRVCQITVSLTLEEERLPDNFDCFLEQSLKQALLAFVGGLLLSGKKVVADDHFWEIEMWRREVERL